MGHRLGCVNLAQRKFRFCVRVSISVFLVSHTFGKLCQREPVALTVSGVDFDSDSLPVIPAFREAGPVEIDRGVSHMDAHPASLALGVDNIPCYCDK